LEDYTDTNGNNAYDSGEPFADLGDAFLDADKDGVSSTSATNGDADVCLRYQDPNACKSTSGDGVRGTAHLRKSTIVYFGGSSAMQPTVVLLGGYNASGEVELKQGSGSPSSCPNPAPQRDISFWLEDGFGNPMAAGTTISTGDPTNNVQPGTPFPSSVLAFGARPPDPTIDTPNIPKAQQALDPMDPATDSTLLGTTHNLRITGSGGCAPGSTGTFAIFVTSPTGPAKQARILLRGQSRSAATGVITVRYVP
jgi:hypothetical protein